jgi:hypothetical protein
MDTHRVSIVQKRILDHSTMAICIQHHYSDLLQQFRYVRGCPAEHTSLELVLSHPSIMVHRINEKAVNTVQGMYYNDQNESPLTHCLTTMSHY